MISFKEFAKFFSCDLQKKYCIEIEFSLTGYSDYQYCWMGKMPDRANKAKDCYWYGLAADGSEAYDYDNFPDFSAAPVFDGRSLEEVWDRVELLSIDGCDPMERIEMAHRW